MKREKILQVLPQREPMLMVDDILELKRGFRVRGYKKIKEQEIWVQGHFPGNPVLPGIFIIEAMAQTALFLSYEEERVRLTPYLAKVNQVKFLKPVKPGDELFIDVVMSMAANGFEKVKASVYLDADRSVPAARGILTCYVGE